MSHHPVIFRSPSVLFLSSQSGVHGDVVLFGAPLDLTESFRAGTARGPERIRVVSDVLETYSPLLDRDLTELRLADAGDLDLAGRSLAEALELIEQAVHELRASALPIMLGGEHTVTLAAFAGVQRHFPEAALVQLDAHLDLRPAYQGEAYGHATWLWHAGQRWGFDRIVQLGVRSGTREEYLAARRCAWSSPRLELPDSVRDWLAGRPVYLTIDIDVLDPSCAPGTGCPEPGGLSFDQVQAFLHALRGLRVVGVDITEVLPAVDHGDITSVAAAKLVREAALLFGPRA